jgi:hypothetical protein
MLTLALGIVVDWWLEIFCGLCSSVKGWPSGILLFGKEEICSWLWILDLEVPNWCFGMGFLFRWFLGWSWICGSRMGLSLWVLIATGWWVGLWVCCWMISNCFRLVDLGLMLTDLSSDVMLWEFWFGLDCWPNRLLDGLCVWPVVCVSAMAVMLELDFWLK